MEEEKGSVCVTGATGYVGSWLIMRLLQHGYSVHATIRSDYATGCKKDISFLTKLPGAAKGLKLFNADLNEPESFNAAIEGCMGVFHLAHPMPMGNDDPDDAEEVVTKRAVKGLIGVLNACLNSTPTVKRVVYTSSLSAIAFKKAGDDCHELDESMWSDLDVCRSIKNVSSSYMVSKIITEKTALDFAGRHGIELVSLVLPLVVGPFVCANLPSSVYIFLTMILGKQDLYKYLFYLYNLVHVDDVASAGIFLLENPNSKGRYICSSAELTVDEMFDYLSRHYPQFELPSPGHLKEIRAHERPVISSKKLLECGFEFKYGVEEMLDGAVRCCKEKGFIN